MADAVGNDPVRLAPEKKGAAGTPSEDTALIKDLREWLKCPRDIETILNNARRTREWMEAILLKDAEDTVVTHHVLRNQEAKLAHLTATKPQCDLKPRARFEAPPGAPDMADPAVVRFGETVELLANFFAEVGNLRDAANNAARDADTVRAGWLKLIWRDDPERQANGAHIFDADLQRAFRYKWLRDRYKRDEFDDTCTEYQSMKSLEDRLRTDVIKQLQSMSSGGEVVHAATPDASIIAISEDPIQARIRELFEGAEIEDEELQDIPRWLGFDFDVIDIEDIRIDWSIDRPEYYHLSRRIGHRTRMRTQQIVEQYHLDEETAKQIPVGDDEPNFESTTTFDKHRDDANNPTTPYPNPNSNKHDVWEIWDRDDGAVYVFLDSPGILLHKYIPRNVGPQWFPFFYLWFHEMAGRVYAPSTVELSMSLQDEINSIRSHAREYRKAALPRLFIGKGAMSEDEIDKFESSHPWQVIEVEKPDDIRNTLDKFEGVVYNPALTDTSDVFLDMQLINGMPTSGLGATGNAKLATEVAFAGEQLATQTDRTKYLFNAFLKRIFREMVYIIIRKLPYENAVAIAGPGLEFPMNPVEREALIADLILEIDTSPTGKPNAREELEHIQLISSIFANQGMQVNPVFLATRISKALNIETDWHDMIGAVGQIPNQRPPNPGETPSGAPSGPAPGTPGGGFTTTPTTAQLPGGAVPR
jgi:hypothetical protein